MLLELNGYIYTVVDVNNRCSGMPYCVRDPGATATQVLDANTSQPTSLDNRYQSLQGQNPGTHFINTKCYGECINY